MSTNWIEKFLSELEPNIKPLVENTREILLSAKSDLVEENDWGNILYTLNEKKICTITIFENHIQLEFFRGKLLHDPHNKLKGTGKFMRFIKIESESDILPPYIGALVIQASMLD